MGWQPARLLHSIQPDVGYPFRICLILKAINMNTFSDEQLKQYHQDGYYLLKNLFDKEEIELLHKSATADRTLGKQSYGRKDGEGGTEHLSLWNHPGNNIYGMFARCGRMVNRAAQILDDEVYHYHSKMILKDARIGGVWVWHQDYGYWYQNMVLYPNLLHRSDQNQSENPRWSMVCCYNAKSNDPYKESHHPRYTPLKKVDDNAIKKAGISRFDKDGSDAFLNPDDDHSATL